MSTTTRVYWDSSCFISLLNRDSEPERHEICSDILNHAKDDRIEIWTSCWTIAETIRPREQFVLEPLPEWSTHLDKVDEKGKPVYPGARAQLEMIWEYYYRNRRRSKLLSPEESLKIKQMFAWRWVRKILVHPSLAARASDISRDTGVKPSDALHVASAIHRNCAVIHRWDHHFEKTDHLIPSVEPEMLSVPPLPPLPYTGSLFDPNFEPQGK